LKVLAATYEPAMVTSVDVGVLERAGGPQEEQDRLLLGAYRITEQALLNSAAHGDATQVDVTARQEDDSLVLVIADNGGGIGPDPVVPGTGTTIIDAWVATMGGTWAMDSSATGTRVTVRIPDEG
jgi:glucose-6-phosphate-specific signal transduction histidine kinase